MYRVDNATAATILPTPAAVGPKPNGFFTKGNPSTGVPATIVDDDWANAVQEELCYIITQAGLALNKGDRTQLNQSVFKAQVGRAYLAATQVIPVNNVATLIQFDTVLFDTLMYWKNGGVVANPFAFKPTKAGYYRFSSCIFSAGGENGKAFFITLFKNGNSYARLNEEQWASGGNLTVSGSCIAYANGTTDYFQIYANNSSTTTATTIGVSGGVPDLTNAFEYEFLGLEIV